MLSTGMWVEKYRPTKLSEIVNQTEIIGSLEYDTKRKWDK